MCYFVRRRWFVRIEPLGWPGISAACEERENFISEWGIT